MFIFLSSHFISKQPEEKPVPGSKYLLILPFISLDCICTSTKEKQSQLHPQTLSATKSSIGLAMLPAVAAVVFLGNEKNSSFCSES